MNACPGIRARSACGPAKASSAACYATRRAGKRGRKYPAVRAAILVACHAAGLTAISLRSGVIFAATEAGVAAAFAWKPSPAEVESIIGMILAECAYIVEIDAGRNSQVS